MSATLTDAGRRARNEYAKKWRQNNPEKVKASTIAYWDRKGRETDLQAQENADIGKEGANNDAQTD